MRAKIVATIGPSTDSIEVMSKMIDAGVGVFRVNLSHSGSEQLSDVINKVNSLNISKSTNIPVLCDLQGPKIRIGEMKKNTIISCGDEIEIVTNNVVGDNKKVCINYCEFPKDVKPGDKVLINDGKLLLEVISSNYNDSVIASVIYGGVLESRKGVNLPNTVVSIPCITEKDRNDLDFVLEHEIEWLALSFVRSSKDIIELRDYLQKNSKSTPPLIIAKIEKPEALGDIDNIIKEADGIMVARGDLGVEIPLQSVPLVQKEIVKKCRELSKPVIVATQMMESMIKNFRPSRAEVNDVANSVLDGADALMLSNETSVGDFPIEVVKTMKNIIINSESFGDIYYKHSMFGIVRDERFISSSIIYSACEMAKQTRSKAIIAMTHSGYSAFVISSHRPKAKIYIFTDNLKLLKRLNLLWGVECFYYNNYESTDKTIIEIKSHLENANILEKGDLVVNIASTPIGEHGKINFVKLGII